MPDYTPPPLPQRQFLSPLGSGTKVDNFFLEVSPEVPSEVLP